VDPITLIVAALAAGATSGALGTLQDDVKEKAQAAYAKLRGLVERRFRGNASAEVVLAEHATDPETYQAPLTKKLTQAGAADDTGLVAAAKALMDLVDQAGARAGKYNVTITGSKGVQVGDGNVQINRF
jgi:RIP homotypic interaction motif